MDWQENTKQFFMDGGLLYGTPAALKRCLDLIEKLEPIAGLKLKWAKWAKMSVHTPNTECAQLYTALFLQKIKVIENEEMNFVYLKTPIGSDNFVKCYLEKLLARLEKEVNLPSEMTHLHECFTLLRSCALACKVTHLMRTIPPNS